jgi:tRNA C32,U32 (ribose-2'-O)-methylase TrmJ
MQGASLRGSDPAERSQVLQLERLVDEVATLSQFYRRGTPPIMRELLPQLLTRMEPQKRELAILLGLFSRIKKTIERMPLMEEETFLTSDNRE